ncbi:hypothetical protein BGW38_001032 [Lunasporangiospora selenospora]|uniref:EF-hand n=1 Tax=Lunasporangiospora selenospora TaxID=979761 RepID=A0A9P6FU07_9FUNG|nr:hypothetical protein BGW38_001032 [Lunasporangiospora selenospora]
MPTTGRQSTTAPAAAAATSATTSSAGNGRRDNSGNHRQTEESEESTTSDEEIAPRRSTSSRRGRARQGGSGSSGGNNNNSSSNHTNSGSGRGYGYESEDDEDAFLYNTFDDDAYEKFLMDEFTDKHEGLQLMNLLYAIAEDQAVKEGHIHRGITCNSCRTVPIRGIRYKCVNCQDYDLCEGCEAAEVHLRSHVFMKIRIPIPPLANSRTKKLPPFYPGVPQGSMSTPEHLIQELQQKTHFDSVELDAMYNQYLSLSTLDQDGGGITRLTFEQALGPLGLEKNLITDRIFKFFDQDDDGYISFKEMACGLSVLCKGNFDEKIDFAFRGYDLDGDGFVSKEELYEMFKAYFYLSMELIRDVVRTMENDLMGGFEYQPGMPISSTFTAPIPREIGVRNNNSSSNTNSYEINGGSNHNGRNREQAPLPEGWVLSGLSSEEDSDTSSAEDDDDSPLTSPNERTASGSEEAVNGSLHSLNGSARSSLDRPSQTASAGRGRIQQEESIPSGTYGLVGNDAFVDNSDDGEYADDEAAPETNKTVVSHMSDIPSKSESPLSPKTDIQEPRESLSDAEDSGVDSNSWNSENAQVATANAAMQPSHDRDQTLVQPNGHSGMTAVTESQTSVMSDSSTVGTTVGSSPQPPRRIPEMTLPEEAMSNDAGTSLNTNSNSTNGRIRKDQPLPPLTHAPHLVAPSISNTNIDWECSPYHATAGASPSPSLLRQRPTAPGIPSLAPAFAIGFGLHNGASSSSPPSSSSQAQDRSYGADMAVSSSYTIPTTPTGSYANPAYFSSTFPAMESMSQYAIQEMVDKTFNAIKNPIKPGFISLKEFRAYVLTDAGILGWFDALGSIF